MQSIMQSSKLRPFLTIARKEIVRNVATASVKQNEEVAFKDWKEIPGPKSLPIIGSLHNFLPGGIFYRLNGYELSEKLYQMFGPLVKLDGIPGRPPLLLLYDAEGVATVLRGENWLPNRPGFPSLEHYRRLSFSPEEKDKTTTGLLTDNGDIWKQFRSAVNPVLMQPKTIKLYSSVLDEVAEDMVARMKSKLNDEGIMQTPFDAEMNLWALESIGIVALGCRLNCFDPNLAEDSPARVLIQCVHDIFVIAEKLDFEPSIWKYFATPLYKKAMKLYEVQEMTAKYFVEQGIENLKNKSKSNDEKGVLEKLLEINKEYAYIMASDLLFAGVDTASNTMSALLYLLATHPEIQNKLREELTSNQEKKPYLKACIKEGMRMMPVVSGNIRLTSKEYSILGYKIPKDSHIVFSHQNMSMMEAHYPRPKEFLPERWLVGKDDPLYYGNAHPFANAPFGFGVRMCIGRRIAELEIETFLTKVIQNFKIEWFGEEPKVIQSSINYFKGPFNFKFKPIK